MRGVWSSQLGPSELPGSDHHGTPRSGLNEAGKPGKVMQAVSESCEPSHHGLCLLDEQALPAVPGAWRGQGQKAKSGDLRWPGVATKLRRPSQATTPRWFHSHPTTHSKKTCNKSNSLIKHVVVATDGGLDRQGLAAVGRLGPEALSLGAHGQLQHLQGTCGGEGTPMKPSADQS